MDPARQTASGGYADARLAPPRLAPQPPPPWPPGSAADSSGAGDAEATDAWAHCRHHCYQRRCSKATSPLPHQWARNRAHVGPAPRAGGCQRCLCVQHAASVPCAAMCARGMRNFPIPTQNLRAARLYEAGMLPWRRWRRSRRCQKTSSSARPMSCCVLTKCVALTCRHVRAPAYVAGQQHPSGRRRSAWITAQRAHSDLSDVSRARSARAGTGVSHHG
jgi:hypothetical protein